MKYQVVKHAPVARFFYKGTHSHPVKRTVLVVKSDRQMIQGYELREGKIIRKAASAPLKTYRRDKMARGANLRPDNALRATQPEKRTLIRQPLFSVIEHGI